MLPSRRTWAPAVVARRRARTSQVGGVAVGQEHVAQHLDVDDLLVEDVAERQHRVGGLGTRERRVVARVHGEEARRRAERRVLDLVDEAVVALAVGHLDLDGVALDRRRSRRAPSRLDRAQLEAAAVGVGVVLEHPHRDRASRPHGDDVRRRRSARVRRRAAARCRPGSSPSTARRARRPRSTGTCRCPPSTPPPRSRASRRRAPRPRRARGWSPVRAAAPSRRRDRCRRAGSGSAPSRRRSPAR